MNAPNVVKDCFLNPGDFAFGNEPSRFRTLLGSCVSIILWSRERKLGGMCHYLLPSRAERAKGQQWDGKYADEAFQFFVQNTKIHKVDMREFQAKVFGGADMFSREERILADINSSANSLAKNARLVGQRNIEMAKELLDAYKIPIVSENTGG